MQPSSVYSNGHSPNEQALPAAGEPYVASGARVGTSPLLETLELLWRGRWVILLAVILSVGAVAVYNHKKAPVYEAHSLLSIELIGNTLGKMGLTIQDELGMRFRTGSNELWKLRYSTAVSEAVAARLMAQETDPRTGEPLGILYDAEGEPLTLRQVAGRVRGRVSFTQAEEGVDAIRMVGVSESPGEAALIANFYAEAYIEHTQTSSRARLAASRGFLEDQKQRLEGDLILMEDHIKDFLSSEGAAALDQEATRAVAQITALEAMRDEARIQLEMRNAELEILEQELAQIEPQLVQRVASGVENELRRVQASIADLELRVQQVYQQRPELRERPSQSAELVELNDRITQLRGRATQLSRQYVDEMLSVGGVDPEGGGLSFVAQKRRTVAESRIAISGLEAKLAMIGQRLSAYDQKLREIPGQTMELAQLQRTKQSTERMFLFIGQKLQEFLIAEESEIGYAELVSPASVPREPVEPKKVRNLFLAFIFGLMAGGGLVFTRSFLDTRIHEPDDLRKLGYSVLGVVPDLALFNKEWPGPVSTNGKARVSHSSRSSRSSRMKKLRRRLFPKQGGSGRDEYVEVHGVQVSTRLAMILAPMSAAAEAFRRMRTNIQFSRPDQPVRTLLITSPEAGEGKSTTAVNLAIAMAQADRRTVIIDADMRRPTVHRILSTNRAPGLSEILFEKEEAFGVKYETQYDNLYLITAGSKVPNPSEALGSRRMRRLVDMLKREFDVVIIDTPPILAFSDGLQLATHCDATILVCKADETDLRAFHRAAEVLQDVGAHVLGGVLNKLDPRGRKDLDYQYGYYYRRYYDYYSSETRV